MRRRSSCLCGDDGGGGGGDGSKIQDGPLSHLNSDRSPRITSRPATGRRYARQMDMLTNDVAKTRSRLTPVAERLCCTRQQDRPSQLTLETSPRVRIRTRKYRGRTPIMLWCAPAETALAGVICGARVAANAWQKFTTIRNCPMRVPHLCPHPVRGSPSGPADWNLLACAEEQGKSNNKTFSSRLSQGSGSVLLLLLKRIPPFYPPFFFFFFVPL